MNRQININATLRVADIAAATACLASLVLAALATATSALTPWCAAVSALAVGLSVLAYANRRADASQDAYTEGFRDGLEAKQVLRLAPPSS